MANCSRCGARATGNFCATCGASLTVRSCSSCGTVPEAGARFCNVCGNALGAAAQPRETPRPAAPAAGSGGGAGNAPGTPTQLAWWLAGGFLIGLVVILVLPVLRPDPSAVWPPPPPTAAAPASGTSGGAPPDLTTMTPRDAADRLYERVMRADAAGDTREVGDFLPMALAAYDRARPLDLDGLYHLAALHQLDGDHDAALAVALEAIAADPGHLLALVAAAESASELGDAGAARGYYQRFLDGYSRELERGLEEYQMHEPIIDSARETARAFTGG